MWRARWPNGSPEKPNDGYTTDGTTTGELSLNATVTLQDNVNVFCQDGAQQPRLVATGVMPNLARAAAHNFSVPCSTIPNNEGLQATAPFSNGVTSTYGPLAGPATYQGGALERFTPGISYWKSTVPNGLRGVARAALKNWSNPAGGWLGWQLQIF